MTKALKIHILNVALFSAFFMVLSVVFLYFFIYEMHPDALTTFWPTTQYAILFSLLMGNVIGLTVAYYAYKLEAKDLLNVEGKTFGYIFKHIRFRNSVSVATSAWIMIAAIITIPVSRPSMDGTVHTLEIVGLVVTALAAINYTLLRLEKR